MGVLRWQGPLSAILLLTAAPCMPSRHTGGGTGNATRNCCPLQPYSPEHLEALAMPVDTERGPLAAACGAARVCC